MREATLGLLIITLCSCSSEAPSGVAPTTIPDLTFQLIGRSITIGYHGKRDETTGAPEPWVYAEKQRGEGEAIGLSVVDDGKALWLKCTDSSFSVNYEIAVDIKEMPILQWAWFARRLPEKGDVRERGANDQVLQVLLGFEDNTAISYIWDSNAPLDTTTSENWILFAVTTLVVTSGSDLLNQRVDVRRNVYEDYEKLLGRKPTSKVKGVRIQSNSQYTDATGEGAIGPLYFAPED